MHLRECRTGKISVRRPSSCVHSLISTVKGIQYTQPSELTRSYFKYPVLSCPARVIESGLYNVCDLCHCIRWYKGKQG